MENSIAYEMLKTLKLCVKILSIIVCIELVIIAYMGHLLYESQYEYSADETQQVENAIVEESSIVQY